MNLTKADTHPAWCPGCGNFAILKTLDAAVDEAGIDRRSLVMVSGIGQAAKLPHYLRANVFNGLHGRAIPAATGVKLANHRLKVVVASGDGDLYGEGGNHLLHAMRRNVNLCVFVHNNQVYGLTKGQASPTSEAGFTTHVQTHGTLSAPLNPMALAVAMDAGFVARTFCGEAEHMKRVMIEALRHADGFALVDILQPCVTFNKVNTYRWYKDRVRMIPETHDPRNRAAAMELALKWGDEIPIGVMYRGARKSFESLSPVLREQSLLERLA
jgi:2-oxoglutarate ferredoxin oxidoreductase subunit beta